MFIPHVARSRADHTIDVAGRRDFTTSEPAHYDQGAPGSMWICTASGAGSLSGEPFVAGRAYELSQDGAAWFELAPAAGWTAFDAETGESLTWDGVAWVAHAC